MAKKMRRLITLVMAVIFCMSMIATPAAAYGGHGGWPGDNQDSDKYEWYQVYVQGSLVASGQGKAGNVYYLGTSYKAGITPNGHMLTWYINPKQGNSGNFSGTVDLRDYITVPDGFTVKEYTIEESSIEGVNNDSSAHMYDNAIIKITIKTLYNEQTGEEIDVTDPTDPPVTDPTDPPATDPVPVETKVAVNHIYKTYDSYTGDTTEDGRTTSTKDATENDVYTAVPVPTYNGNTYVQQTDDAELTITVVADASENVITIEYLRTIDTTPEDYIPVLEITKTADKEFFVEGETVTWTITVKNISEYTAYNVVVTDELTDESWTIETLAAGAEQSFTASLENAEIGLIENVAVVTWEDGDDIPEDDDDNYDEDDETVDVIEDLVPVVQIVKTADKEFFIEGETVTWTITVMNIGEDTAYNVVVTDELTGESWTIEALAAGAQQSFTASLENAEPGLIENVAVVTWEDGDDIPEDDDDNYDEDDETVDVIEDLVPVLDITKTADQESYTEGNTVTWTITVKNISEYTAYNVVVTDELTDESWTIEALEPGAQQSFTATLENAEVGLIENVAVVTWEDGDDIPEDDEDNYDEDDELVQVEEEVPVDPAPVLRIVKTSSKYWFETGETVTWYISVENISEYTAYNVILTDELTNDRWVIGTLEPGASRSFATTTETEEAGSITNVAVVTWTDGDDIPDGDETDEIKRGSDDAMVIVHEPDPGITVLEDDVPVDDGEEILDEDVPLAAAPKTGDISGILEIVSLLSLGGVFLLKGKKEEE